MTKSKTNKVLVRTSQTDTGGYSDMSNSGVGSTWVCIASFFLLLSLIHFYFKIKPKKNWNQFCFKQRNLGENILWLPEERRCYFHSGCMLSCFSHVRLFETLWTVAHQASLSMRFSRQEYWSGLSFPSPGDLPDPGIKLGSPILQADSLPFETPIGKPNFMIHVGKGGAF